jgi:hypothetical protein
VEIRCVTNTGVEPIAGRGLWFSARTVFPVRRQATYVVLGLGVFNAGLVYLIPDDQEYPSWFPAQLFETQDATLPPGWAIWVPDAKEHSSEWQMRAAYPAAASDDTHRDGLAEGLFDDLSLFRAELKRRREPVQESLGTAHWVGAEPVKVRCLADVSGPRPDAASGLTYLPTQARRLTVGREYVVYGAGVYRRAPVVLVADDDQQPAWLPTDLFEFTERSVPAGWEVAARAGEADEAWVTRIGYPMAVTSDADVTALLDREPEPLSTFEQLRRLIEGDSEAP